MACRKNCEIEIEKSNFNIDMAHHPSVRRGTASHALLDGSPAGCPSRLVPAVVAFTCEAGVLHLALARRPAAVPSVAWLT